MAFALCHILPLDVCKYIQELCTELEVSHAWVTGTVNVPSLLRSRLRLIKMTACAPYSMQIPWAEIWVAACKRGDMRIIVWLYRNKREMCPYDAVKWAARYGYIGAVRYLIVRRVHIYNAQQASRTINRFIASFTYSVGYPIDWAAKGGHLNVVRYLHANRISPCTADAMDEAAKYGHIHVMNWLREHCTQGCSSRGISFAAARGHLDTVQWLVQYYPHELTPWAIRSAAQNGHAHIVQWLVSQTYPTQRTRAVINAMNVSASSGRLNVLRWLFALLSVRQRPLYTSCVDEAMCWAASNGHEAVVKWLFDNGVHSYSRGVLRAIAYASDCGYHSIARWLRNQPSTPPSGEYVPQRLYIRDDESSHVLELAAGNGHLETVQWLCRHGMGWRLSDTLSPSYFSRQA